jgi:hypothetical protein
LLNAPTMASIVSVWKIASMVAKPGLRTVMRLNTPQPSRREVFWSGNDATRSYSRLGLALRVSVSFGGTVSRSGSAWVPSR